MCLDHVLHDGEAKTGAALVSRAGAVGAIEALEDAGKMIAANAPAGVAHAEGGAVFRIELDAAIAEREAAE